MYLSSNHVKSFLHLHEVYIFRADVTLKVIWKVFVSVFYIVYLRYNIMFNFIYFMHCVLP